MLDSTVEFYFRNGLATSTQKAYTSAKRRYLQFCQEKGLTPLPAAEHQLCQFVSLLANQSLCHNTIKSYLAAVRHLHIAEGYGDPHISRMAKLEQVLRGIKLVQAKGEKKPPRLPITPQHLTNLRGVWLGKEKNFDGIMLWAAASLCFFGFMRSGELTIPSDSAYDESAPLCFKDVTVDSIQNPQALRVRLKASKTDPFRVGVDIFVGKTGNELCPVTAVLSYMVKRGPSPGPFFRFASGAPLTRPRFVASVKEALAKAGVDAGRYSGHSFRSGAATTAASRGVGDAAIKMLGRWKSSAYQLYIKTPREQLAAYTRRVGGNSKDS